ncbi:hypothetical protein V3F56_09715 [Moorellaceae bacterium AZ2]
MRVTGNELGHVGVNCRLVAKDKFGVVTVAYGIIGPVYVFPPIPIFHGPAVNCILGGSRGYRNIDTRVIPTIILAPGAGPDRPLIVSK